MQKKPWILLGKIAAVVFLLYAVITIVNLQTNIAEKKEQLNMLDMRVEEYNASNDALREKLASGVTDADISEVARTSLGYAEPGERVFVDTSSK